MRQLSYGMGRELYNEFNLIPQFDENIWVHTKISFWLHTFVS